MSNRFIVGDTVRVISPSPGAAHVGRVGVVYSDDGAERLNLLVRFEAGDATWCSPEHLELVDTAQPTQAPYEFKVGDKGKTRSGDDYEVIAKLASGQPLVVLINDEEVTRHEADGHYYDSDTLSGSDLLSPATTITVYLNITRDGQVIGAYREKALAQHYAGHLTVVVAYPVTVEIPA